MADMIENYGLENLVEDDESTSQFLRYLISEGKPVTGYYGNPYYYKSLGNMEFWVNTNRNSDGKLEVIGFSSHCAGPTVWVMENTGLDLTPGRLSIHEIRESNDDSSTADNYSRINARYERVMMFRRMDGQGGTVPVHLINADIIPSFLEGDRVTAQMIALPVEINYFADDAEYDASLPETASGQKWGIGDGALIPLHFLSNHDTKNPIIENTESDSYISFRATVKGL